MSLQADTVKTGECPICLENFSDEKPGVPVNHTTGNRVQHCFHHACIKRWADGGHRECPCCRQPFNLIDTDSSVPKKSLEKLSATSRSVSDKRVKSDQGEWIVRWATEDEVVHALMLRNLFRYNFMMMMALISLPSFSVTDDSRFYVEF